MFHPSIFSANKTDKLELINPSADQIGQQSKYEHASKAYTLIDGDWLTEGGYLTEDCLTTLLST